MQIQHYRAQSLCSYCFSRRNMKYSPKKQDILIRAIYFVLLALSVVFMNFGNGYIKTVFYCLSIADLVAALYLIIKYEMTKYEYLVINNNDKFFFCINKYIGRRGGYVCYFPMEDACELLKKWDTSKKLLKEKYKNITFYSYCQNITKKMNLT